MKHLKIIFYLLLMAVINTSCEKEAEILLEKSVQKSQFEEIGSVEKQKLFNQIIENFNKSKINTSAKEEITYKGQLCGDNITGGYSDETDYQNLHNYYFNGNAGDVISIYVPRTTAGFDSAFHLYFESIDGENNIDIWHDDDIADLFGGCYSDPYLGNYTLPYSGLYTLTVVRAASCSFPYGYEIITTGITCDPDLDDDGILNIVDNCPNLANPNQLDNDEDGTGDVCDDDDDNDGVLDGYDNCPLTPNSNQANNDGDSEGDVCDSDDDNDGFIDGVDYHPFSNTTEIINIGGCNPNVDNKMVKSGSTMMDQIDDLIEEINTAYNGDNYTYLHKRFVTKFAQLTYSWRTAKLITATQRSQISTCASNANIPYANWD